MCWLHSFIMSIAEAGTLCCLCFFPHRAKCENSSGRMCLLLSQLRLFPVTFQPEKIFTPENREDNFPSLNGFQWHLACVRRSSVRNSKSEKTKPEQCLLNHDPKPRMFHQIESKILVYFSNTYSCSDDHWMIIVGSSSENHYCKWDLQV